MRISFIFLLLFAGGGCVAQERGLYPYGELGLTGCVDGGTALIANNNFVFRGNNIISVGFYEVEHPALNTPADYNAGSGLFGPGENPTYELGMVTVMYGKMLFVPGAPEVRFAMKGGIGVGRLSAPEDFVKMPVSRGGWLSFGTSSNYDYTMVNSTVASVLINPSVELSISRGFGIRLGALGVINNYHSTLDLQATMLFGRLRNKLPKRARTSEVVEPNGNDIY